jgi:hypothetical protein
MPKDPYYRYYDPDDPYDPYSIAMSRYSHFRPEDPPQAPGWRSNTGYPPGPPQRRFMVPMGPPEKVRTESKTNRMVRLGANLSIDTEQKTKHLDLVYGRKGAEGDGEGEKAI